MRMLSVSSSSPPAVSIFIIIEVPERGSPDTIVMVSLFIESTSALTILL